MDPESREQLIEQLLSGYDSLNAEARLLHEQRRQLENKLAWAKQQFFKQRADRKKHLEILKRFTPDVSSVEYQTFLSSLDEAGSCQQNGQSDWVESLSSHEEPERRTRAYNIRRADIAYTRLRALPIEQDFTTPGTPSRLGCPFVAPPGRKLSSHAASIFEKHSLTTPRSSVSRLSACRGRGKGSRHPSMLDPIQAEIGVDPPQLSPAAPPSIEGSATGVCPIRFLDQHSPEEVATYFEKHKHEIPRSHEVCVKRYQSNEASIRQLDAKYGNLVSMIQGLGEKHQTYLPPEPALTEDGDETRQSNDKVTSWAAKLSNHSLESNGNQDDEEERVSHFDRPLRDVRVGESPSRPWGIPVPSHLADDPPPSPLPVKRTPTLGAPPVEAETTIAPVRKCPFDHTKLMNGKPDIPNVDSRADSLPREPEDKPVVVEALPTPNYGGPPMVFNGPVFIGFSMEQAMELLKQNKA